MTRLASIVPARTIRESRRCLTGRVTVSDGAVAFESSLERDWLVLLDFAPNVTHLREQPFTLSYDGVDGARRYTPDVLATFLLPSGADETVVYEVKPRDELKANWALYKVRFKAASKYCKERGWRFRIVTEREIRTARLGNAKFLRRYRNLDRNDLACKQLLYTFKALGPSTPQALLAASYRCNETRMAALPMLWMMLASGEIGADLDRPLTMASAIWLES